FQLLRVHGISVGGDSVAQVERNAGSGGETMKAIVIGAGRGSRLKAMTDSQPKCYASIGGRRILDWALEAFDAAGLGDKVFIGGYQIDMMRRGYPTVTFAHNADWMNDDIRLSLSRAG